MSVCGDVWTTTVPVRRRYASSSNASYTGSVHANIVPSSLPALGKPSHLYVPLPSQTERDTPTVVHPLLQQIRGGLMIELAFPRSLSSIRVFVGHEDCVNKTATIPPLPPLVIVHPKLL